MLDIRLIRERPDYVKEQIAKLQTTAPIDEILAIDEQRRATLTEVEGMRAQLNEGSRKTGKVPAGAERDAHIAEMRRLGDEIAELNNKVNALDAEQQHDRRLSNHHASAILKQARGAKAELVAGDGL